MGLVMYTFERLAIMLNFNFYTKRLTSACVRARRALDRLYASASPTGSISALRIGIADGLYIGSTHRHRRRHAERAGAWAASVTRL